MEKIQSLQNRDIYINKKILKLMKNNVSPEYIKKELQKIDNNVLNVVDTQTPDKNKIPTKQTHGETKVPIKHPPPPSETKAPTKQTHSETKAPTKQTHSETKAPTKQTITNLFIPDKRLSSNTPSEYKKYNNIKIGITCAFFDNLYSNGHKFNVLLWYDFLKICGYDTYFIVRKKTKCPEKHFKYIKFEDNDLKQLHKLNIIFMVGTMDQSIINFCLKHKKRYIYTIMGSTYHNDVRAMINPDYKNPTAFFKTNEIWLSPHFDFCREYYKIKYKTNSIYIGPYFWREDLLIKHKIEQTVNKNFLKLKVAIVEPNIELAKNSIIPIAICEKAKELIEHVYVFNSYHLKDNTALKCYIGNLNLYKDKKISIEKRYPFGLILSKFANCVVSCQRDCELNYVHLECFYLGIPLIHNSKLLKDYGYYYPDYNVSKGAKQIKNILANHNRDEYIKRHKTILEKYSVYNPCFHAWVHSRINNNNTIDCL